MIPVEALTQLATLGLTPEQAKSVAGMLRLVEDATNAQYEQNKDATRELDRLRKARQRERETQNSYEEAVKEECVDKNEDNVTVSHATSRGINGHSGINGSHTHVTGSPPPSLPFPSPPRDINSTPLLYPDPSLAPAPATRSASGEISANRKQERQESEKIVDDFLDGYSKLCAETGLKTVRAVTDARKSKILARAKDLTSVFDFDTPQLGFRDVFNRIRGSPFMLGKNKTGWKVDIDWLIIEGNFLKLMEDKYAQSQTLTNGLFHSTR